MRIRPLIAALPLLVLAACGTEGTATPPVGTTAGTAAATETATASASATESGLESEPTAGTDETAATESGATESSSTTAAPVQGPEEPASTAVADPPADPATMPLVTGAFGVNPTVTFPDVDPPSTLERQVLSDGDGAVVKKGELIVVNYSGRVWDGTETFDSSFDEGRTPAAFSIGTGNVVAGWDTGLVGMKVGSRVLLSVPPKDGYGVGGKDPIKGTDTMVFVVDIINTFDPTTGGQADATPTGDTVPNGVTVTGDLGKQPTVTIADVTKQPTAESATVLAHGTGAALEVGKTAVLQIVAKPFSEDPEQATWTDGQLQQAPVTDEATSILSKLVGVEIGSRVVIVTKSTEADATTGAAAQPAVAFVIDVIGQF